MTTTPNAWLHRAGTLSRDGWSVVVDGTLPGWRHTGLRVADLGTEALVIAADQAEHIVIPLHGDATVEWANGAESGRIELAGRESVFDGPADAASFPPGTSLTVTGTGRLAVASATADAVGGAPAVVRAGDVPVELRGAGRSSRQVHGFGMPGGLPAQRLLVCEVITPEGNWSSYPAHKHDTAVPGSEAALEEIYYFEAAPVRGAPDGARSDPFGMFATYASPAGDIATEALVRSGDVALVPHGYHGPAAAAPGYDLYYLNVMAGPAPERAWLATDDPRHGWVRDSWQGQAVDPRLPYGKPQEA